MPLFNQFTWSQFLILAASLVILYFILHLLNQVLNKAGFLGNLRKPLKKLIHTILLIYEPVAILLLGSVFMLINFIFHGVLILLILVLGFAHIRNYVSGQIIKFDSALTEGRQITSQNIQGIVSGIGKLGLRIKTHKGRRFVDYTMLLRQGYVLLSGENIGGYYHLRLEPADNPATEKENAQVLLKDRLAFSPYLDWNHKPELLLAGGTDLQYKVKVVVKEESHLYDLMAQIKEWGYNCKIVTK